MVHAMLLLTLEQTPRVVLHRRYGPEDTSWSYTSVASRVKQEWLCRLSYGEREAALQRRLLREVGEYPESIRGYFRMAGVVVVAWRASAGTAAAFVLEPNEEHILAQQVLELVMHRMEECCRLVSEPPVVKGGEVRDAARLGTAALVISETLPCGVLRPLRDKALMRDHRRLHNILSKRL